MNDPQAGSLDGVRRYYEDTWFDYTFVWLNRSNLALHFGYHDDQHRSHDAALSNMNRVLADKAGITRGERVLDAGCGVGGSSLWLARNRGANVVGITPVAAQVIQAQQNANRAGLAHLVSFEEADYSALPTHFEDFDAVWALESLCHAPSKAQVYAEFFHTLNPGGRLIISEYMPRAGALTRAAEARLESWMDGWSIPNLCSPAEHYAHARNAGFIDIRITDESEHVAPSLRRLYQRSKALQPASEFLRGLGIRNNVQQGNVRTSVSFYESFSAGDWVYCQLSAQKPTD